MIVTRARTVVVGTEKSGGILRFTGRIQRTYSMTGFKIEGALRFGVGQGTEVPVLFL